MTVVKQMYKEKRSGMKSSRASRCRKWKSASVQRGEKVRAVDAQRQDYCASDNASNGEKWLAPELDTSDMCASLNESKTVQLTDLAMALRRKGVNVVAMTAGEPDFATPEPICAAAHAAMEAGRTGYPPNAGLGALREAICDKLRDDNGLDYSPADIVVSGGAKQSCAQAVLATCGPGDEVIVPCPHWVSYPEMASLAGATAVRIETCEEDDFLLTPEALRAALTPKSRMLILCSPSNPTGAVYTRERLLELAEIVCTHPRLLVLSDEIYEHLVYAPHTHISIASIGDALQPGDEMERYAGMRESIFARTIVVNGFSKAYAMTGWRLGYAASAHFAAPMAKIQSQLTSGASILAQYAALEALPLRKPGHVAPGVTDVAAMVSSYESRRNLLLSLLDDIDKISFSEPAGAFYLFVNVQHYISSPGERVVTAPPCGGAGGDDNTGDDEASSSSSSFSSGGTISSDDELCAYFLAHGHLAVVPGSAFGCAGYIRLSYAVSENTIVDAVRLLKSALEALSVDEGGSMSADASPSAAVPTPQ